MKKFFGSFADYEDFINQWSGASSITEDQVLIAEYNQEQYEGNAFCLFKGTDGKLYEVYCSHCSCNGLDSWVPEEANPAAWENWKFSGTSQEFKDELAKIVAATKEPKPKKEWIN